jgi:hypothetical protein
VAGCPVTGRAIRIRVRDEDRDRIGEQIGVEMGHRDICIKEKNMTGGSGVRLYTRFTT